MTIALRYSRQIVSAFLTAAWIICSQVAVAQRATIEGTLQNDHVHAFLINNIFSYYSNNGFASYNALKHTSGMEYPAGSGKYLCYIEGVIWGGYHKGAVGPKVGGSAYRTGLQAGKLLANGTPVTDPSMDDPTLPVYRVYRVRPDVHPGLTLDSVAAAIAAEDTLLSRDQSITSQQIFDQYITDWNEWPAADGAPYLDVDSNGVYSPATDIPGRPGASQTLWFVANDMNQSRVASLAGSSPIGLEIRRTIWGYSGTGFRSNAVLTSTVVVNKSGASIDSMFLVQWADPDIGNYGDDYVGWDGSRDLGFAYNGLGTDSDYGTAVPAAGFLLLQGPVVASVGDTAIFQGRARPGFRNLRASAFSFFTQGNPLYRDPVQGVGGNIEWFRLMNGRTAATGAEFINPTTSLPTRFVLSGDPVAGTGWLDGTGGLTAQDRRICMVTGPFTMAAGDTQELVVAQVVGVGGDRISSIGVLRWNADLLRAAYLAETGRPLDVATTAAVPSAISLEPNFPNPFNPSTTLRFTLPARTRVQLSVYNALGQRVATLVDGEKDAGIHEVVFNATGLASGMYLCRLQAGGARATQKLILAR